MLKVVKKSDDILNFQSLNAGDIKKKKKSRIRIEMECKAINLSNFMKIQDIFINCPEIKKNRKE